MTDEQEIDTVQAERAAGIPMQRGMSSVPPKPTLRLRAGCVLEALTPWLIALFVVTLLVGGVLIAL